MGGVGATGRDPTSQELISNMQPFSSDTMSSSHIDLPESNVISEAEISSVEDLRSRDFYLEDLRSRDFYLEDLRSKKCGSTHQCSNS